MGNKIKFKRGSIAKLPQRLAYGEPAFVSDEQELYIGTESGNNIKLTSKSEVENIKTQLNKKRNVTDSILMADLSTEVKKAMTGGSVAVVDENMVGKENLKDNSVTTNKIIDTAISTNKIADYAVTTQKLQVECVTEGRIAPKAVTKDKLADGCVTQLKLADRCVNTDKLDDLCITTNKLGNNCVASGKRTPIGNFAYINTDKPLEFNTKTKKLTFKGTMNKIACGDKHIDINSDQVTNGITFSSIPTMVKANIKNGLISEGRPTDEFEISLGSIGGFFNGIIKYDGIYLGQSQTNSTYKDYQSGFIYFKVPVNQNFDNIIDTNLEIQDSEEIEYINCVLVLPTSYTKNGTKTKLMMSCHGAGRSVGDKSTNALEYYAQYTNHGYALFDVNGGSNSNYQHMGSPRAIEAYWKAYQYVVNNYNVEDKIYLHGQSMGGLMALNFANAHPNILKCVGLWYPCTDLYNQAWLRPWNTTGGNGTYTTKQCIAEEYNFTDQSTWEPEKIIGYNPIEFNSVIVGDKRYNHFPVPIKIWHGTADNTVSYQGSVKYIEALRNGGSKAYLRTMTNEIHKENQIFYTETLYWFNRF